MKIDRTIQVAALVLILSPLVAIAQTPEGLEITVFTDKASYNPGEPVHVWFEICNRHDEEIIVLAPMYCFESAYRLEIVDEDDQVVAIWSPPGSCMAIPCEFPQPPHSCNTEPWSAGEHWGQELGIFANPYVGQPQYATPGIYRVRITWLRSTVFYSAPFEIRAIAQQYPVPELSLSGRVCLVLALLVAGVLLSRRL